MADVRALWLREDAEPALSDDEGAPAAHTAAYQARLAQLQAAVAVPHGASAAAMAACGGAEAVRGGEVAAHLCPQAEPVTPANSLFVHVRRALRVAPSSMQDLPGRLGDADNAVLKALPWHRSLAETMRVAMHFLAVCRFQQLEFSMEPQAQLAAGMWTWVGKPEVSEEDLMMLETLFRVTYARGADYVQ